MAKNKAELEELAKANNVELEEGATVEQIKEALDKAEVDYSDKPETPAPAPVADDKKKTSGKRYFKSTKAGLSFLDEKSEVSARFVPYFEKYQGDTITVGYLELPSGKLADRVGDDPHVTELSAKEYKDAIKDLAQAGY